MKVVEAMERITKNTEDLEKLGITSVVAYGTDIHKDMRSAQDYNLLFVINEVDLDVIRAIHGIVDAASMKNACNILVMERSEIEGMMDSVPETFLHMQVSFQTLYGTQPFKGLSAISHEHLRAQTERCLRESLCKARVNLINGFSDKGSMVSGIKEIQSIMEMSMRLFHVMSRPWITEMAEHREALKEEFPGIGMWLDMLEKNSLEDLDDETLKSLGHNLIDQGIKPMLIKVDELGP